MPETVLRLLVKDHEVRAVVRPAQTLRSTLRPIAVRLGLRSPDPLRRAIEDLRIPRLSCKRGSDAKLADSLRRLDLDLIVIASFPVVLSEEIYNAAHQGAVNLHTSLLPRHRGPLPMFWVYHEDDRETGVTVHQVTRHADRGNILAQARFDLPRGYPIQHLYDRSSEEGSRLLLEVLSRFKSGSVAGAPQDDRYVTNAPRLKPGVPMVDFQTWPVERVWHFLKGMYPQYSEKLSGPGGKSVSYSGVQGYAEERHEQPLGAVQPGAGGWRLFCRGGFVMLDADGGGH
jgi:methionyl-tRNA formyltransferase